MGRRYGTVEFVRTFQYSCLVYAKLYVVHLCTMFKQEQQFFKRNLKSSSVQWEGSLFRVRRIRRRTSRIHMEKKVGFMAITKDWLLSSSMHGLKYIAEDGRHWIERIFWIILFCCSLSLTVCLTMKMWEKWEDSPVYTALGSTSYPVRDMPFPGVTICNVNKVLRSKLVDWLDKNNRSVTDETTLRNIAELIVAVASPRDMSSVEVSKHAKIMGQFNLTGDDVLVLMKEVAQPCEDMIQMCTWQGNVSCIEHFHLWLTDSGYCCVFNSYDPAVRMKTVASGRNANTSNWYVLGTSEGVSNGLTLHLQPDLSEYIVTSSAFIGFQVQIHHPEDIAEPEEKGFPVSESTEAFGAISSYRISSTRQINSVSLSERMCFVYDNNEAQTLHYFTNYSLINCFAESLSFSVEEACKCVPYSFAVGEARASACNISQYPCLLDVVLDTTRSDPIARKCLPTCEDTFFNVDVTYGIIADAFFEPDKSSNLMPSNQAILHLFHQSRFGVSYITDELFGVSDFVAASGGNFGLGFGFSLLSAIEIVYFFTIRWFFVNWPPFFLSKRKTVPTYDPTQKQSRLAVINLDFNTEI